MISPQPAFAPNAAAQSHDHPLADRIAPQVDQLGIQPLIRETGRRRVPARSIARPPPVIGTAARWPGVVGRARHLVADRRVAGVRDAPRLAQGVQVGVPRAVRALGWRVQDPGVAVRERGSIGHGYQYRPGVRPYEPPKLDQSR